MPAGVIAGMGTVIVEGKRALGVKLPGKFGRIHGQVTYNGWPLYLFTGEKARMNHADSAFKVVRVAAPAKKPASAPTP
jgi:hypothetical protein